MGKHNEIPYLPVEDDSEEHLPLYTGREIDAPKADWLRCLLMLEALHLVMILGGYVLFLLVQYRTRSQSAGGAFHGLDTYFDLSEYNTVKVFYGDASLVNRTAASDALFDRIQHSDGVVAIDTEWALRNNYAPSHVHPEDPTKSVYQIDMFHSMHCVYRLRNKLTSSRPLEQWPRNDQHTLHCLDYIREQLMCNPDLSLQGTTNLIHFNVSNGHTCRNVDMITDWAKSHHWEGHRKYLIDTLDFD